MDYKTLYEKNAKKFENRPNLKKALILINQYLPFLFVAFYVGFFVYAIFSDAPLREDFPFFVALPLAALATASALRIFIARPRPYCEDGANITPIIDKKRSDYRSCPSRHIACAVAIALAFVPFSTAITVFLLLASVVLAYLRFTIGAHYVSDLLFGACVPCVFFAIFAVLKTIM